MQELRRVADSQGGIRWDTTFFLERAIFFRYNNTSKNPLGG